MNIPCANCDRRFGGHESFKRHRLAREDRCKKDGELRASGLYSDIAGVWRRTGSRTAGTQAAFWDGRTRQGIRRHSPGSTDANAAAHHREHRESDDTEAPVASSGRG